jgi:Spy/CpxP family protein refolding chaperone
MTKRNLTIAAAVIALVLVAVPIAYAQHRMHHGGPEAFGFGMMGHLGHLKAKLDLTDEQADQIKAIAKNFHEENAQLHGGLKSVAKALIANPNDLAGAQAILDQQAAAEKAFKANALVAASKALNVLTPEQRTKLGELMAEREEHRIR